MKHEDDNESCYEDESVELNAEELERLQAAFDEVDSINNPIVRFKAAKELVVKLNG